MLTIYRKAIDGLVRERYYHTWESAKKQMLADMDDLGVKLSDYQGGRLGRMTLEGSLSEGFKVRARSKDGHSTVFEIVSRFFSDTEQIKLQKITAL